MRTLFFVLILSTIFSSCLTVPERISGPPEGRWRATLNLDGFRRPLNKDARPKSDKALQFEEVAGGELPFLFDLEYTNPQHIRIKIYNADETIVVDDVTYGWNKTNGDDTIRINFPHYDSYITALYEEGIIEGSYVIKSKNDSRIPFLAKFGQGHLFSTLKKTPKTDISGKWKTTFGLDTDKPWNAIGEFQQEGNKVKGTFITETGDFRYLSGTIQADKVYLSTFDGSHAFLFEAKITDDNKMIGAFRSGSKYKTLFEAERNENFELTHPEKLTYLKEGYKKLSFSFPNTRGEFVSLDDEKFKNKYKIVQILGTWCPNCGDETAFLKEFLNQNKRDDIAVVGLAFEKHKEEKAAFHAIRLFKKRFGVDYPILWAGSNKKEMAAQKLPMLNDIISYPTMIFLNPNNEVIKIHTGFYGPATSKYKAFQKDFYQFIHELPKH